MTPSDSGASQGGDTVVDPTPTTFAPTPTPPRRGYGPLGWAIALIVVGMMWLLQTVGVDVRWRAILPLAVVAVGIALLLLSRTGGHGGLITLGVVLTLLAVMSSFTPGTVAFAIGQQVHDPTVTADVREDYGMLLGQLTVDLRDVDLTATDAPTRIEAGMVMGEVVVRVPEDVTVVVAARSAFGQAVVAGRSQEGVGARVERTLNEGRDRVVHLEVSTVFGKVEVTS